MRASLAARTAAAALVLLCAAAGALPGTASAAADLAITSFTTSPNPLTSVTDRDATVTITVRNAGDANATVVAILFTAQSPDEEVRSITCPASFTAYPNEASGGLPNSCVWGTIAPGAAVTMTAAVRLGQTESRITSFTHSVSAAQARQSGSVVDPTPADNQATEVVSIAYDPTLDPDAPQSGGGSADPQTRAAPAILALTLAPQAFRAAANGPSALAARTATGTVVTTRLSVAATETFRVERAAAGRRVGGRCVAATRRNRRATACTRWPLLTGRFTATGEAGVNRLRFTGRLAGLRLGPGRYRLAVTATDARGRASAERRVAFRILSP